MKKKITQKHTASDVLNEHLEYGGLWMTRADILKDLLSEGFSPRMADKYLFYLSQHQPKMPTID